VELQEDLTMLRNYLDWPLGFLPVVSRREREMGIVLASDLKKVYKVNMWNVDAEKLANAPQIEYGDEEALIKEWRID